MRILFLRSILLVLPWVVLMVSCRPTSPAISDSRGQEVEVTDSPTPMPEQPADVAEPTVHVRPDEDLQAALDRAAEEGIRKVVVHAGTYRPPAARQALIWFNQQHNGLDVRAEGEVVLTAANEQIADRNAKSFPAVVNHVVYFGDGIGPETRLSGFKITGANDFVTTKWGPEIEPTTDERLKRTPFFYTDGGGIKVFGRSYPTLENLEICDNYSSPCGAGISVEHRGFTDQRVTIRDCIFRNNRVPLTGAALDLLDHEKGSAAVVENCLFLNNLSNCSMDSRSLRLGTWRSTDGHGAVTVFAFSKGEFVNCTFVGNRNGVDDLSASTTYSRCIFWRNDAAGGWATGPRYETDIANPGGVKNCYFGGVMDERSRKISPRANVLDAPDPQFDSAYNPQNTIYRDEKIGYRATQELTLPEDQGHASAFVPERHGLDIAIRGRNFNWHMEYLTNESADGSAKNFVGRRNLVVPANTEVRLRIDSDDYLYTISFPNQSVKQIAVPGMTHHSQFRVEQTGVYPLIGDQFCGYTHPNLIGKLIVQSPTAFQDWLRRQSP